MSDRRVCLICDAIIDIDSPDAHVIARSGGGKGSRTTVVDSSGVAHIVRSKAVSDRYKPVKEQS